MSSCLRSKVLQSVDLDKLVEEFNLYQRNFATLRADNATMQLKVDLASKQLQEYEQRELASRQEISHLQAAVEIAQQQLVNKCDFQDKNRQLEDELRKKNKKMEQIHKEHEEKVSQLAQFIDDLQKAHAAELTQMKDSMTAKGMAEVHSLQQSLDQQFYEIQQLRQAAVESERERQAELMKLRVEYESKLQKQAAAMAARPVQTSAIGQDIYRKKLQNVMAENGQKVAQLERTIQELQQQLMSSRLEQTKTQTGGAGATSLSYKRGTGRKF